MTETQSLFTSRIRTAWGAILDLLYPQRCGGCGRVGQGVWCDSCRLATRLFRAADVAQSISLESAAPLIVVSAAPFAEPLRRGIHEFKYAGVPGLAEPFGALMGDAWRMAGLSAELIAPVPLHPRRQRERGFNQSELLGRRVIRETGMAIAPGALKRTRHTEHQAQLSAAERKQNVQGAFTADARTCSGKHVLLIDDVLTTGMTLTECAAALRLAGAAGVAALTLARAGD